MTIVPLTSKYLRYPIFVFVLLILSSCGGARGGKNLPIELEYLDEYIIPADFTYEETLVGGLSTIEFDGEYFYSVVDLPSSPRIYKFAIEIDNKKIDTIRFKEVIHVNHKTEEHKAKHFDLEGLIYDSEKEEFIISSEGSINNKKDPFIATLDRDGNVLGFYEIPEYFKASFEGGPRNNGVFEGLDTSVDGNGIWVGMELPLEIDGPTVKLYRTKSPVRIIHFDNETKLPTREFVYRLDRLRKMPLLPFAINGLSGMMTYAPDQFIIIERAYSAGHGSFGNRVRLYFADARSATNTLGNTDIRKKLNKEITPAKKELLFDFKSVHRQLSKKFIDNIEGIIFGPTLANGNQSLILISDNNFNSFSEQINQVILMEVIQK